MGTILGFGVYKTVTMHSENEKNEKEELTLKWN